MKKQFSILTIIVLLSTSHVFAGFTLTGSTITQSGTDSNLSGLTSVPVVTTQIINGQTLYFVGNNNMIITGNLTINPLTEQLVFGSGAPFRTLSMGSGSLTIGANRIVNGSKLSTDNVAISFNNPNGSTYDPALADMSFTGGTFTWNEGKILLGSMIIFGNGNFQGSSNNIILDIKEGTTFEDRGIIAAGGDIQLQIAVPNGRIDGLKVIGNGGGILVSLGLASGETYSNPYKFILEGVFGITNQSGVTGQFVDIRDYSSSSNSADINLFAERQIRATNLEAGSGTIVIEHNTADVHAAGLIEGRKEVELMLKETEVNGSATIADAIYYIQDYNNGDRRNGYGYNYTTDRTYLGTTNASGRTGVVDVLTFAVVKTAYTNIRQDDVGVNKKDRRSKYDDTRDAFDIHFLSYGHNYRVTEQQLKGVGVLEVDVELAQDPNITEVTRATVDGYTTIDNLDQLYDRAKSWKVTTANIEYPTIGTQPVTGDGTVLDLGNRNILIDASAGSAFAINTVANTITIKSTAALVAGTKFNSIRTTGTVSTAGGASLEFGYEDATGINKYVALSNLSNTDTVLIRDNILGADIVSVTGITGDYKAHFIAPADASDITVSVTRPSHSSFTENYPETDLSFVRAINLQLTNVIAETQIEMLNLVMKVLQKEEAIYRALDLTNPTLTVTNTISGATGTPTEANQLAILEILNKIFVKVIANRRKLE